MKIGYPNDIKNLPPPEWIIHELIQTNSTILFYGPSTVGKSFSALEMMFALACQHEGIFKPLVEGLILYVVGEGLGGLGVRLKAWELDRELSLPEKNPAFVGQPIQIANPKSRRLFVDALRKEFGERKPLLIIFDTLARCAVSLDENSAKDMGELVEGLEQLRLELQCSIMLVHHSTKANPKTERGSGAVFGAVDTVLSLLKDGNYLKLECPKQKNGHRAPPRRLQLKDIELPDGTTSCVLDTRKVAQERNQLEALLEIHISAEATTLQLPKRVYMRDAFPPREWDWDGEAPVCAVELLGSKVHLDQIAPDDAYFQAWLKTDRKYRQEEKSESATVNPFSYSCESQEFWQANATERNRILETRRQEREDRLAGNGLPAVSDIELAWWIWGIVEMGVIQADVIRWLDIQRGQLQRNVQSWRRYGLLPFKQDE